MKSQDYTRTSYEIHTSEDGEKWFRKSPNYEDTPKGLAEARNRIQALVQTYRFVRICHSTRHIKILAESENPDLLSKEQIATLLLKGEEACKGIKGLSCNEGFNIGFNRKDIDHGPVRVTISFNAAAVIGKPPQGRANEEARRQWNMKSIECRKTALDECVAELKTAGVTHIRGGYEIELKP